MSEDRPGGFVRPNPPRREPAEGDDEARMPSSREELFAMTVLGAIILVTIAWWMLALWPVAAGGPDWVLRTRAVCFGSTESGLPDAEGWALLVGQPIGMTLVLLVGWGRATGLALAHLAGSWPGRVAMGVATLAVVAGLGAASVRVAQATASDPALLAAPTGDPAGHPRLDRPAPTGLRLLDQSGETFDLARYTDRGRPVLVTFAFAHCETVCPVLVREVLAAQRLADEAGRRPAVVVVTVDPWRDTPSRLPHVAHQWGLDPDGHVLSGSVDEVLETLDAWEVNISRDELTGEVTHPALVYVVSPDGSIAFVATGGGEYTAGLVGRV